MENMSRCFICQLFLFNKNISKDKFYSLCGNVETVSHLFLECKFVKPLVKIILSFLRKLSANQIKFSEYVFKFPLLPQIPKLEREICLICYHNLNMQFGSTEI